MYIGTMRKEEEGGRRGRKGGRRRRKEGRKGGRGLVGAG